MAPFTGWLPVRSNQGFDLVVLDTRLATWTFDRVVIVESSRTQSYWNQLRPPFSCDYATLTPPQQGQSLTPMDIFLREGSGAV